MDEYSTKGVNEDAFLAELERLEHIDRKGETLFNQMIGYYNMAVAYGALKQRKLDYTKAYYRDEYVYKEVSCYHNVQYIISRVTKEQWAALYMTAFSIACRSCLNLANTYDHLGRKQGDKFLFQDKMEYIISN